MLWRGERDSFCSAPPVWCQQDSRVELREGDVADTALLLPVHRIHPGSPGAAGREELSAVCCGREHRAALREPLWDWSWPGWLLACDTLWEEPPHTLEVMEPGCQTSVAENNLPLLPVLMGWEGPVVPREPGSSWPCSRLAPSTGQALPSAPEFLTCPTGRGEAVSSTSVWCCPSLGPFGPCCWGSFLQE